MPTRSGVDSAPTSEPAYAWADPLLPSAQGTGSHRPSHGRSGKRPGVSIAEFSGYPRLPGRAGSHANPFCELASVAVPRASLALPHSASQFPKTHASCLVCRQALPPVP